MLVGIHHLDNCLLVFVLLQELDPACLMIYLTTFHLLHQKLAEIIAILSFTNLFVSMLFLIPLLLLLQNVFRELRQPIVVVQPLEIFILSILLFELVPFHPVTNVVFLHNLSQTIHTFLLLDLSLLFFLVQ